MMLAVERPYSQFDSTVLLNQVSGLHPSTEVENNIELSGEKLEKFFIMSI